MLSTLAIENYRSLRHVVLPLGRLNVVTGANGSGKSNLYRALRLLAESSRNGAVAALAREGGLPSTLWAGPENLSRAVRAGEQEVQGTRRRGPVSLRLGFASDDYGYAIDLGPPVPGPRPDGRAASAFDLDPEIKRECTWSGPVARPATMLTDRRGGLVQVRADDGSWQQSTYRLNTYDSMLSELSDPERATEVLALRERIRAWRFYDHFRTDARAPARAVQIGTRTAVLGHDGADLAAAWQTIVEVGDTEALYAVLELAFPGSTVEVRSHDGLFSPQLGQPGMLRPLTGAELSDGTLRFLLLVAALLTPRPPELMVLNEPESSLHPDLLPGLAQLVVTTARRTQIVVVSHSRLLLDALADASRSGDADLTSVELVKELGQTTVVGQDRLGRNTVELAATMSAPPAATAYVHTDDGRGPAVEFLAPATWADALAARSEHPGAVPIAGGTDVMVELNFDRHRPDVLIDLTRVPELSEWSRGDDGGVRLGAGVSFARVMTELADTAPGLAMASRTVGSPQIRARGTVGGNLGSASPAGDAHPVLLAVDAVVEVESVRGVRQVPVADFFTGVKKSALEPDELISAVLLPPVAGPQQFAKIGTRNAMVIAVTSFGLALHPERQAVGAAIGSAAPTPRHARTAEAFLAGALADHGLWESRSAIPDGTATRFGDLVAADASPIDDVRGTAAYRRHALSVLARRTLGWAWQDYQREAA